MDLEHPDITSALKTGYPRDYSVPEPYRCPVCGATVDEQVYKNRDDEIIGCDRCVHPVIYWEIGGFHD